MPVPHLNCSVHSEEELCQLVRELKSADVAKEDISILFAKSEKEMADSGLAPASSKAAGTGGMLGGALGWLVGAGILVIPGWGFSLTAAPLLATLGGALAGAAVGGITGILKMEIPESTAKRSLGNCPFLEIQMRVSVNKSNYGRVQHLLERYDLEKIDVPSSVKPVSDTSFFSSLVSQWA